MAEYIGLDSGVAEDKSGPVSPAPVTEDAVFGEITESGLNYQDVGWVGTVALMMKTQFGLGVLSIPQILDSLGNITDIIYLSVIAAITTWSNYVIGTFKLKHPMVYAIDDAGDLIFGRVGREVLGFAVCIYWIFCSSSALLSTSIRLNAVSAQGTCTADFVAMSAFVSFGLASIRTLGKIKWTAWIGVGSVFTAVMITTIEVGVQDRPPTAPMTDPWISDYKLVGHPSFTKAITEVSSVVFAYAGIPGFFPIAAEMRNVALYTRSLFICQAAMPAIYIAIGTVIYYYCGSYVASPALGSAVIVLHVNRKSVLSWLSR
ncbi:hypothetical protein N7532_002874 [Penicillium argentinense]|uniref:Amino acid transporter transmembrane domain-containing protein n=1 Tax=Penicillium argentinense TaxID=1131581 RepID=A0A9W9G158_9EURO|nr:uncharacterized protein N7532_002874 [Penicillium argentinense]KAJ5110229.1 hypothetical protein N7532_002874 [Penicillium argentinense]